MKVVFLSAFYNHHQSALSAALSDRCDYTYVATSGMPTERRELGYGMECIPDYVVDCSKEPDKVDRLLRQADVIIAGSAPEKLVRACILRGQLVFRYSERPLKNGPEPLKYLPRLLRWHWRNPPGKRVYLLCASAFAAGDYGKFGLFRGRAFRWGYFPEVKRYEDPEALLAGKKRKNILWAGRFLSWKHPDDALKVAKKLKAAGYDFTLQLIGTGEMDQSLRSLADEMDLGDRVRFLGSMKPEEVRRHMEESEIFLFTSDRGEGWGAVLNESMNSGCAVVASDAIGAVPYLIRNGENGIVYRSGDMEELYQKVRLLMDQPEKCRTLGSSAYRTMRDQWEPELAAHRLLTTAEKILDGTFRDPLWAEGPCSAADTEEGK